jgi:uncharacterized protein Yka (UPF0111/DUF47 family)
MKVNDLEEDGDERYMAAVRSLFEAYTGGPAGGPDDDPCKTDPCEIIKWREIYHKMELCFDACEDLVDTMEGVIIKNT